MQVRSRRGSGSITLARGESAIASTADTVVTKTVTKGKGGTRVQRAKYEATKRALLKVVPRGKHGILFRDLSRLVKPLLPADMLQARGSASWLVTVVKLDLEARGVLERVPGKSPQCIRRVR